MPNYRQLHEESLQQNRPQLYQQLKQKRELKPYLDGVQQEANELHRNVKKGLSEKNPYNPVDWKNSRSAWEGWLERSAKEVVLSDLVLVPDQETAEAMRDGYQD